MITPIQRSPNWPYTAPLHTPPKAVLEAARTGLLVKQVDECVTWGSIRAAGVDCWEDELVICFLAIEVRQHIARRWIRCCGSTSYLRMHCGSGNQRANAR